MRYVLLLGLLLSASGGISKALYSGEYEYGTIPPRVSKWPDALKDYQELPESRSPDGEFGFIYPRRNVVEGMTNAKLYLARLKPFQIMATMPLKYGNLCGNSGSGYFVKWRVDSSAALFYVEGKRGPFHIFVVSLKNGRVASLVDLETPIRKLVQESYAHSLAPPFNNYFDFIITDGDYIRDSSGKIADVEGYWSLSDHGQVLVKCICTNDPKHISTILWEVIFEGTWDIEQSRFIDHHFERIAQTRIPMQ